MTLKKRNEKVYMCPDLKIDHMGWKSSFNVDENFEIHSHKLRNWHYMWSFFYYHKKNDGYLLALKFCIGKLFRSFFKMIFYSFLNQKKKILYKYRFLGAINSILGK